MNKLLTMFKTPCATEVARTLLAKAKRDLLSAEAQREHSALIAEYQRNLISRLTRQINSGELA